MVYLIPGLFIFFILFCLHLAWWRIKRPVYQRRALIFMLFAGVVLFPLVFSFQSVFSIGADEMIYGSILFALLWVGYVITYSALEEDSPTLSLLLFIARHENPRTEEIVRVFSATSIVMMRLKTAADEGMVVVEDTRVVLTPKGRRIAGFFMFCQRLWSLPTGG